jgi:DNA polymerase I
MNTIDIANTVFIIDGSSFLYRAYYSMKPLHTKDGKAVQAVYGFCRMIKKLLDTHKPDYIIIVWDSKGKTVRHELYEAYKNSRQAPPSDLIEQKELIIEFADSIKIRQLHMQGVEADDLMFSLAQELQEKQVKSIFVTSDKDMGQALNSLITMLDPFKESVITQQDLEEKYGFAIAKLPFYYALVGDTADSIPGVKGIGPKSAQKLVQQFNSLEDLYTGINNIDSERIKNLLTEYKPEAFLSQDLFTLRFYQTALDKQSCAFTIKNWKDALPLFEKLGFKSLLKDYSTTKEIHEKPTAQLHTLYTFICVNTPELLAQVCAQIKQYKKCALDTEGTSIKPLQSELLGISICVQETIAYYIPFGHKTEEPQLSKEYVIQHIKPLLEDESIEKYLHHAKFDALMLSTVDIELKGITFDTIIAASLVVPEGQRIGLKYLSEYYFQEPMLFWNDVVKKNKYPDFSYVPLSLATQYAAADAHQTLKLQKVFEKEIEHNSMTDLFHKLEMPLMLVLYQMEKIGIFVDTDLLDTLNASITKEINSLHLLIIDLLGENFTNLNLNSPKQLEEVLFNHLKLPTAKKTTQRTGYSTDQEVLKELAALHPIPGLIIRYRELFKLKSTYLEGLKEAVNAFTGRVHTTFSQTAVATGRLASSDPNLQNIPVDKYHIRAAFKAPKNYLFLSADYSQIELRVLAHLSQDSTLVSAFKNNQDIHTLTAAGLFDVNLTDVTHEQRQVGKRINFSILYGLTAHGLSKDLHISHKLAREYIERYMAHYPGVVAWMETIVEEAHNKGYVQTLWGRRRSVSGIFEKNKNLYELARRIAINTVVQGTAAELMKWGMINLSNQFSRYRKEAQIVIQIHDELLVQVAEEQADYVTKVVTSTLENVVSWDIPLVVTTRLGSDWQKITK